MDSPPPAEIQYQRQHIHDDRSNEIIAALGICLGIAIIAVLLRFVARHLKRAPLEADDWTIVAGLLCAIGYVVAQLVSVSLGTGRHAVVITNPVSFARVISAGVVFYICSLAFTKLSILLLYRRVFPNRGFHALLWAVGLFVVAFTIANVCTVIFGCKPIAGGFNPFIKAKCIDHDIVILVVASMTTATDFIILLLPLPLVWQLRLPIARRLQLTFIFLLGIFTSVVSIYRATQISNVSHWDASYDATGRSIWSGVEICTAILCANLATIRPIIKYLFNGKSPSTTQPGTTSKATLSGTSKTFHPGWTWRSVMTAKPETNNHGRFHHFHRLKPQVGVMSIDDLERQKDEGHVMSPLTSPVNSPRQPQIAHF
ncbi:MAG: hypothetical protein Q9173_006919 [Seirophora scorigena]